jgi:hypothetical protein
VLASLTADELLVLNFSEDVQVCRNAGIKVYRLVSLSEMRFARYLTLSGDDPAVAPPCSSIPGRLEQTYEFGDVGRGEFLVCYDTGSSIDQDGRVDVDPPTPEWCTEVTST